MKQTALHGLLVIDKPAGMTSRDVVDRAQHWLPPGTRVGHTGTLDPLATGVLVLCVGNATRLTEYVQNMRKVYRAGVILGAASDTDDADGVISSTPGAEAVPRDRVDRELSALIGTIAQVPPAYSAAKVRGRRAYALARKGKAVELQPRQVTIHRVDVLGYEFPKFEIEVECSKGTYIRSLARDVGQRLGCGGYVASLRRLSVGWFTQVEAISLDAGADTALERLQPVWRAVQNWQPIALSQPEADRLRSGQRVPLTAPLDDCPAMAVLDDAGRVVAVAELIDGWLRPIKVLARE